VEFAHAIGFMHFNRLDHDIQPLGDFLVAKTARTQAEHHSLAVSDRRGSGVTAARTRNERGRYVAGQRRIDVLSADSHGANGMEKLAVGTLFQDVSRDSGSQQFLQVGLIRMASEYHDLDLRSRRSQCTHSQQPASAGHRQVHDDQINVGLLNVSNGIISIAGLTDDLHVILLVNQQAETFPDRRMILRQYDSQRRADRTVEICQHA